jgi:hypothetical protein
MGNESDAWILAPHPTKFERPATLGATLTASQQAKLMEIRNRTE